MKHHHHLVGNGDAEGFGQFNIEYMLRFRHLNFQVMIPRTERSDLVVPTFHGSIADFGDVGARDATPLFRALQILRPTVPILDAPARALLHDLAKFVLRNLDKASTAHARRDALKEPVHQLAQVRFHFVVSEVGEDEPHSTIDVKTNTPR